MSEETIDLSFNEYDMQKLLKRQRIIDDTNVIVDDQYIKIDYKDKEIIYWEKQEWMDDPEIVVSIAQAIMMAAMGEIEEYIKLSIFI